MSIKDLSQKLLDDMKTILEGGTVVVEDTDKKADDPCWKGYKQVGMKKKDGKEVPNCVPMNEEELKEAGIDKSEVDYSHIEEDASNDKSDDGEGLDKADPKAAKKKFKDRKDKDIDNDGDVDDSDEFLHKKRKAISKNVDEDSHVEIDKDDEEDDDVVKKPEDDEEGKKLLKTGKGGKYLKYSNLLLKKQKMSKAGKGGSPEMTAINKEISAERKKLGISESTLENLLIHYLPEDEEIEITEKMLYKSPTGWSFEKHGDKVRLTHKKIPEAMNIPSADFKVLQRIMGQVQVK